MSFLQKNKSILVAALMVAFLAVIVSIFVSGLNGAKSDPTPSGGLPPPLEFATSTGNVPAATRASGTPLPDVPSGTMPPPPGVTPQNTVSIATPQSVGTLPPSNTEAAPGTNAPPPPASNFVDEGPPGTDFPPPLTFVPLPTETPPPGNGSPPGS